MAAPRQKTDVSKIKQTETQLLEGRMTNLPS
jgi:hypothetical protein